MADGAPQQRGRVPASDLDAEAAVLSAILHSRECLDDLRQVLKPHHFYADANRRIYETTLELENEGKPVDVVLVSGRLRERDQLQKIGGAPYLAQLVDATPAIAHVLDHARVVTEKARIRAAVSVFERYAAEGYSDVGDPQVWVQNAAQVVSDIAASGDEKEPAESLQELVQKEFDAIRERARRNIELSGLDTKLTTVNGLTGGLTLGKLHVVGARPGMGKTSYALQLALNTAEQGLGVVFGSAEMDKHELTRKAISMESRVPLPRVKSGKMQHDEWRRVAEAAKRLAHLPIVFFYMPGMTIAALRSVVRKEQRGFSARGIKLGLVAADYLQLMNGRDLVDQGATRENEVSAVSRRLTWMAGEFDVPLLALSQLNRGVETRDKGNKRPGLADLRESGAIEQDAYTIQFIYRDEYYNRDSPDKGVAEIEIAKNRGGPTGRAYVRFTGECQRFDNLAGDEPGQGGAQQPDDGHEPAGGDEYHEN